MKEGQVKSGDTTKKRWLGGEGVRRRIQERRGNDPLDKKRDLRLKILRYREKGKKRSKANG